MSNPNNYDPATSRYGVRNNVMRETFDYIKQHPNSTSTDVCAALSKRGFNAKSVSAIVAQMLRAAYVKRDENRKLVMLIDEYTPIKYHHKKKGAPTVSGIAALKPDTSKHEGVAKSQHVLQTDSWTPMMVVDYLTLRQARQVYDYLHEFFGGKK